MSEMYCWVWIIVRFRQYIMSNNHLEILSHSQKQTLPLLKECASLGKLAGGSALALQLGHRKSYDFDIFSDKAIPKSLLAKTRQLFNPLQVLIDTGDELSIISEHNVKVSFIFYPFAYQFPSIVLEGIPAASWKDIALDKAYTIGRRGEWRDYIDLYFCIHAGFTLREIIHDAKAKFGNVFSEKLLLSHLYYMGDIQDFSIELMEKSLKPEEIKEFFATQVKCVS